VVVNDSSVREEKASKNGSLVVCYFATRITARPAMGGSFSLATAIIQADLLVLSLEQPLSGIVSPRD
jgi:hypothetical protein